MHADAAGFMAAMLSPGMRAISITISTDSGAGGFILPNDRVDLLLTRKGDGNPPRVSANTILTNVRVLAVDQTFKQEKEAKTVIGKTATLELTPDQAEQVARAQNQGIISLSLRPLSEGDAATGSAAPTSNHGTGGGDDNNDSVSIIRYGVARSEAGAAQGGKPQ